MPRLPILIALSLFLFSAFLLACGGSAAPADPAVPPTATPAPTPTPVPIQVSAVELYQAWDTNQVAAEAKYKDQWVLVTGKIADIAEASSGYDVKLTTDDSWTRIVCKVDAGQVDTVLALQEGQYIAIHGLLEGKGFSDIVVENCTVRDVQEVAAPAQEEPAAAAAEPQAPTAPQVSNPADTLDPTPAPTDAPEPGATREPTPTPEPTPSPLPITIAEYAIWCGGQELIGPSLTGEKTNKEVIELIDSRLTEAGGIVFPDELGDYHKARTDALVAIKGYLSTEPPDQPFNFLSLIGVVILVSPPVEQAEKGLSIETRSVLVDAGCIPEESTPEPTPEPTPLPPGFTLDNAVAAGSSLLGADGAEILITGVAEDAWYLIQAENQYNDPPQAGNRFYMLAVAVANNSGSDSIEFNYVPFSLIGSNRKVYDFQSRCGSIPNPLEGELYPGGKIQGNICFEVAADDSEFILIHQSESWDDATRRFVSIYPLNLRSLADLMATTPEPDPAALAMPAGMTLDNPAEVGGVLPGSNDLETVAVSITGDAWPLIQAENQFNDPPQDGNRFYMVTVAVTNASGSDSIEVGYLPFSLIGSNLKVYNYQNRCGSIPDALEGELFPGGKTQGNLCFEVPQSETGFILIYQPEYETESRRFLRLE